MLAFRADLRVAFERRLRAGDLLFSLRRGRVVIDERPNRDQLRELRHGAVVVGVEVRDEQVVDPLDAGRARGGEDAVGVARLLRIARKRAKPPWPGKPVSTSSVCPAGVTTSVA